MSPTTTARRRPGGATGRVGLLATLTVTVVGGTAAAAVAPVHVAGFGGGRFLAAAVPGGPSSATGHRGPDGDHDADDLPVSRTVTVRTAARAGVHRDGRERRLTAWRVRTLSAPALVARNRATATASGCTGCAAVAVSVQVVLGSGNAGRVDATNRAVARTSRCTRCSATALAYQFVVAAPGRLRLTDDARERLRVLRGEMRDVARHADPARVTAREDALAAQIADVLRGGLVVVPPDGAASPSAVSPSAVSPSAVPPSAASPSAARPDAAVRRPAAVSAPVEVTVHRARDHAGTPGTP